MKSTTFLLFILVTSMFFSCEEQYIEPPMQSFLIKKGSHYANQRPALLQTQRLIFDAQFNETAKYVLYPEIEQHDVNKLLGFADCNDHHHTNSARFGWRWLNNKLEIFAYCYVEKERIIVAMGEVALNETYHYSIELLPEYYVFQINNRERVFVERRSSCEKGAYLMLFPYFGGNKPAPNDINILLKIKY